ncbi:MAG: hypothetical protein AAFX86_13395 [Pseudomonadota bacterium]
MGDGNKVEFLVAVCALIVSAAAVWIAWDQARLLRTQQSASVWPLIQISQNPDYSGDEITYDLVLENAGIGPALIGSYQLGVPEMEDPSVVDFMGYLLPRETFPNAPHTYAEIDARVLRPGARITYISARWEDTPERTALFRARLEEYISGRRPLPEIEVCYCSLLDECWVSRSEQDDVKPRAVSDCTSLSPPSRGPRPSPAREQGPQDAADSPA